MSPANPKRVNTGIDKLLRLVALPLFEGSRTDADFWRIRFLQVGATQPEAIRSILEWSKSSRKEVNKIAAKLRKMAESEKELKLSTTKRVGPKKRIVEVIGDSARLFCFYDETKEVMAIIAVDTFWIGSGDKNKNQSKAIARAEALLERWEKAAPVPGHPDLRLEH